MTLSRRSVAACLLGASGLFLTGSASALLFAQDSPNRREVTIVAKDFRYAPDRVEVVQDDLVKLTVRSEDVAHSFVIDEYRIVKRVPAGGSTTFEFRADRPGTFPFYCNLTSDAGHRMMHGELVVRPK